jgi:hypothetical protein
VGMVDGVVWLPANSRAGGNLRLGLGAGPGDVVRVRAGAPRAGNVTTDRADPSVSSDRDVDEARVVSADRIVTEGPTVSRRPLSGGKPKESPGVTGPDQGGAG